MGPPPEGGDPLFGPGTPPPADGGMPPEDPMMGDMGPPPEGDMGSGNPMGPPPEGMEGMDEMHTHMDDAATWTRTG